MVGQTVILSTDHQRFLAKKLVDGAPEGAVVNIRAAKRTLDQNALMWARLSDISRAKPEGKDWQTDVWKAAFMSALGIEAKLYGGIDGGEPFLLQRSSNLTVAEMADLLMFIAEYGDRHEVQWSEPHPDEMRSTA